MSSLQALQVLLVDDNQHMRAITSAVLQSAGVRKVREAADGAAGLEILREQAIDLAIVDFNMFPLDGVEFTRLVRNSPDTANPYLPIIMMTGHSEKSRVYEARDAGVTEFVVKPITAKAILDRIQAVIFRPRPFVKTEGYFGPDRRRTTASNYKGPLRRSTDQADEGSRGGSSAA
ncbi:MAG: response regulator [Alphaproteobacteria bacterium]|uniref:response regulator n=1 Tax=Brevundimonas sp. TaxID=1871086 RepID=UPI0017EC5B0A|nr:response regulator [Brevundimonas sp.]MBA3050990.1 response regulator [Brevundimonas sp.]MBU3973142.1 response regulator [Alphaproteobacteria bacterium]MBU4039289.1 response regulator [Alphaproteobacteria bacterium]MBU4137197.1 response regulator [Alphaproteobacteria bacterium]